MSDSGKGGVACLLLNDMRYEAKAFHAFPKGGQEQDDMIQEQFTEKKCILI